LAHQFTSTTNFFQNEFGSKYASGVVTLPFGKSPYPHPPTGDITVANNISGLRFCGRQSGLKTKKPRVRDKIRFAPGLF